jgi:parallel beta-helix repeat protein
VRGCRHDGVYVYGQAAPTLRANQIVNNAQRRSDTANLNFDDESAGTVAGNTIEGSERRPGVLLSKDAHPLLDGNQILRNRVGIYLKDRAFPTLKDNRLEGNGQDEVDRRRK